MENTENEDLSPDQKKEVRNEALRVLRKFAEETEVKLVEDKLISTLTADQIETLRDSARRGLVFHKDLVKTLLNVFNKEAHRLFDKYKKGNLPEKADKIPEIAIIAYSFSVSKLSFRKVQEMKFSSGCSINDFIPEGKRLFDEFVDIVLKKPTDESVRDGRIEP